MVSTMVKQEMKQMKLLTKNNVQHQYVEFVMETTMVRMVQKQMKLHIKMNLQIEMATRHKLILCIKLQNMDTMKMKI